LHLTWLCMGAMWCSAGHIREIIDEIRTLGWPGVLGNTDEMLWTQERPIEMTSAHPQLASLLERLQDMVAPMRARIGDERLRWLRSLPIMQAGEGFAVVHASPKNLWQAPMANAADEEIEKTHMELGVPVVVYGHIHVSHVRRLPGMTVANAGSVSQSYDADRHAAYALDRGREGDHPSRGIRPGEGGQGAAFRRAPRGMAKPDFAGREILPPGMIRGKGRASNWQCTKRMGHA